MGLADGIHRWLGLATLADAGECSQQLFAASLQQVLAIPAPIKPSHDRFAVL